MRNSLEIAFKLIFSPSINEVYPFNINRHSYRHNYQDGFYRIIINKKALINIKLRVNSLLKLKLTYNSNYPITYTFVLNTQSMLTCYF